MHLLSDVLANSVCFRTVVPDDKVRRHASVTVTRKTLDLESAFLQYILVGATPLGAEA